MTNYQMLFLDEASVRNFVCETFVNDWWKPTVGVAKREAFDSSSKTHFDMARAMHKVWLELWNETSDSLSPRWSGINKDFGWWLCKEADTALLIPNGVPVYTGPRNDALGITVRPLLDGCRFNVNKVMVSMASGEYTHDAVNVHPANIPAALMEYAKGQALKELHGKCPLIGEGIRENDGADALIHR